MKKDYLLKNGTLFISTFATAEEKFGGRLVPGSLLIRGQNIARIDFGTSNDDLAEAGGEDTDETVEIIDCRGLIICPGLIDLHAHVYAHATSLGVGPVDEVCLKASGVTTVVDGGSAGGLTVAGLRHYVADPAKTRVLAFLHIAAGGLSVAGCSGPEHGPGGELDSLNVAKEQLCIQTILDDQTRDKDLKNRQDERPSCPSRGVRGSFLVGVKLRLDTNITDGGRNELEALRRAGRVTDSCSVPLMLHHTNSTIPIDRSGEDSPDSIFDYMKKGDIYTHCFSPVAGKLKESDKVSSMSAQDEYGETVFDRNKGQPRAAVLKAREKGILFDVGHGQGSFSWEVARSCINYGFFPDTISTDMHSGNIANAVKSLLYVASKFIHLGMPLEAIIEAITSNPAKAIKREDSLGHLIVDREADITLLEMVDLEVPEAVVDSVGLSELVDKQLVLRGVFRAGERVELN